MCHINYKTTIWQKAHFKDEKSLEKAVDVITTEGISSIFDPEIGFIENKPDYNTEEYVEPYENDDQATIEAYIGNSLIWSNE